MVMDCPCKLLLGWVLERSVYEAAREVFEIFNQGFLGLHGFFSHEKAQKAQKKIRF